MFEVVAVAGGVSSDRIGTRFERAGTVCERALSEGRTRRAADLSGALISTVGEEPSPQDPVLLIPLVFRTNRLGLLVAPGDAASGHPIGPEEVRLLEALAANAATAVNTAQSVASDRLRHSIEASERERQRWARELHDETLQGLGALQVLLSSALRGSREELTAAVRKVVEQVGTEIASLRALITELRPAALDELGLVPAIETLAERTATVEGLTLETNVALGLEAGSRLDPETESTVYRVTQEALTNVVKHARASRVKITLVREGPNVELTVADDGVGFDSEDADGGFGLLGMRERVALVGGRLEIEATPGEGTILHAQLPAPA